VAPAPSFLAQKPKIAKPFLSAPPFLAQEPKIAKRFLTAPSFLAQKREDRQDRQPKTHGDLHGFGDLDDLEPPKQECPHHHLLQLDTSNFKLETPPT